ncbi:transporter substrate-binding domain-containing protein [Radiobacillus deserti]|uniref:Transporter substrate-binding domain-containing protein n=1 Tax=Radiobacillus deserti TaxID=2594883 RepID=A0A516KJ50_9BACI|nr:transporter substrate-binding domain-containing protein [Radiobacillus deserti]QDP41396.1 transporter substrate-binding domain-containing protein [Radiobacillus deserti]
MKKRLLALLALVLSTGLLAACGTGDSTSGDSDGEKTYTVATDANFQPFEYKNPESGEMEGFDIDLIKAIADEAGFNVEFKTMEFDGLLASMRSGKFPIGIAGISITDKRKETISFSDSYYDSGLILAVPKDSDITSIDDVSGLKVGARQGSTAEAYLKENTDAEVVAYPEIVTAYMNLEKGRLDAVLYDLPNVTYYIKENAPDKLKTVGDVLEGQPYGIAFPKDSELVDPVNEALSTLKEDGTYDEIYKKWFGTEPPQ